MIYIVLICLAMALCLPYLIKENKRITITNYQFSDPRVNKKIVIAHLSDIHNDLFGKDNEDFFAKVKEMKPDIILITGDFLDKRRTNIDTGEFVAKGLVKIAPVYMVTGNHEAKISSWIEYKQRLENIGFHFLNNECLCLENGLEIVGLDDVRFASHKNKEIQQQYLEHQLSSLINNKDKYRILMSHQPQFFDIYKKYDADLILSGHAHGGQVRIPKIGGLFAPNQGVLPKYTANKYVDGNRCMIVSRGLGNSLFPLRVNDNPEMIRIEILPKE